MRKRKLFDLVPLLICSTVSFPVTKFSKVALNSLSGAGSTGSRPMKSLAQRELAAFCAIIRRFFRDSTELKDFEYCLKIRPFLRLLCYMASYFAAAITSAKLSIMSSLTSASTLANSCFIPLLSCKSASAPLAARCAQSLVGRPPSYGYLFPSSSVCLALSCFSISLTIISPLFSK